MVRRASLKAGLAMLSSLVVGSGFYLSVESPLAAALPLCQGTPDFGELSRGVAHNAEGGVGGLGGVCFFKFYLTHYAQALTLPMLFLPVRYTYRVVDDITGNQIDTTGNQHFVLLDPGYYLLKVSDPQVLPSVDFKIQVSAQNAGFDPGKMKTTALPLAQFELGNLTLNGNYKRTRYIHFLDGSVAPVPSLLMASHEYVLRDWVGAASPEQWYNFELGATQEVEVHVDNLYAPTKVEIERIDGTVVGVTTDDQIATGKLLPQQKFKGTLAGGQYLVRIFVSGGGLPGTPFRLWVRAT